MATSFHHLHGSSWLVPAAPWLFPSSPPTQSPCLFFPSLILSFPHFAHLMLGLPWTRQHLLCSLTPLYAFLLTIYTEPLETGAPQLLRMWRVLNRHICVWVLDQVSSYLCLHSCCPSSKNLFFLCMKWDKQNICMSTYQSITTMRQVRKELQQTLVTLDLPSPAYSTHFLCPLSVMIRLCYCRVSLIAQHTPFRNACSENFILHVRAEHKNTKTASFSSSLSPGPFLLILQ